MLTWTRGIDVVWPTGKQMEIIDSLFHNFYVPPVIFAVMHDEEGEEVRVCVDGKQRLTSIVKFLDGHVRSQHSSTPNAVILTRSRTVDCVCVTTHCVSCLRYVTLRIRQGSRHAKALVVPSPSCLQGQAKRDIGRGKEEVRGKAPHLRYVHIQTGFIWQLMALQWSIGPSRQPQNVKSSNAYNWG